MSELIVTDEATLRRLIDAAVREALEGRAESVRMMTPDEAAALLGVTSKTNLYGLRHWWLDRDTRVVTTRVRDVDRDGPGPRYRSTNS